MSDFWIIFTKGVVINCDKFVKDEAMIVMTLDDELGEIVSGMTVMNSLEINEFS